MPKVLIADDSLSVRKVAERLLVAAGFDVALAANGEEALARFTASQPDVLIADVIMPDKSGFEVCAYVRAHATLSTTPVLLISGVVDDEITRQAVACRADGVIKKPFHGTSLRDRVFALLASRQASPPPADAENIWVAALAPKDVETRMSELEEQDSAFRKTAFNDAARIRDLEVTLAEEQKHVRELEEQNSALRETALTAAAGMGELQVTFAEKHKHAGVLEEQISELRESTSSAAVRIRELEVTLTGQQTRSAALLDRMAAMEHAASCAQRLADILAEIGRFGPKP